MRPQPPNPVDVYYKCIPRLKYMTIRITRMATGSALLTVGNSIPTITAEGLECGLIFANEVFGYITFKNGFIIFGDEYIDLKPVTRFGYAKWSKKNQSVSTFCSYISLEEKSIKYVLKIMQKE